MSDYANAPACRILATHCCVCSRPLLDSVSVEMGIGPDCRKRLMGKDQGHSEEARTEANRIVYALALVISGKQAPAEFGAGTFDSDAVRAVYLIGGERAVGAMLVGDRPEGKLIERLRTLGFDKLADKLEKAWMPIRVIEMDPARGNVIAIEAPYNEEAVSAQRGIPGRMWDKQTKRNYFPAVPEGSGVAHAVQVLPGRGRHRTQGAVRGPHRARARSDVARGVARSCTRDRLGQPGERGPRTGRDGRGGRPDGDDAGRDRQGDRSRPPHHVGPGAQAPSMTIPEDVVSEVAPWVLKGAVTEILDEVVFDFWTGQLPMAQEMGVVLERVRASLARVRVPTTLLRGVVRLKRQMFVLEVHTRAGLLVKRSYDRPVLPLAQLVPDLGDDDAEKTIIDTTNNLLGVALDSFDD